MPNGNAFTPWMNPDLFWDRFWSRVDKRPGGCWIWNGARTSDGYGRVRSNRRHLRTHRVAYLHLVGHVPEGLVIDHLCRERLCCNPEHLEAVTPEENYRRGSGAGVVNAAKTHCPKGHEYSPGNTGQYKRASGSTYRRCLTCARNHMRSKRAAS